MRIMHAHHLLLQGLNVACIPLPLAPPPHPLSRGYGPISE